MLNLRRALTAAVVTAPSLAKAKLLIALPHSSSTSARITMARMANVSSHQDYPCFPNGGGVPQTNIFTEKSTYFTLSRVHHDLCQLRSVELKRWLYSNIVYKQHLAPTPENVRLLIRLLGSSRVVVLLREPMESLRAACERVVMHSRWCRAMGRPPCDSLIRNATDVSMLHALRDFEHRWRLVAKVHNSSFLLLTYEQLVREGREPSFARALEWWRLPRSSAVFEDVHALYVNRSSMLCKMRMAEVQAEPMPVLE